jgi:hypothetical protein
VIAILSQKIPSTLEITSSIREGRGFFMAGLFMKAQDRVKKIYCWIYGIKERLFSLDLKKKPHSSALTSNLLIKKEIFAEYPLTLQ